MTDITTPTPDVVQSLPPVTVADIVTVVDELAVTSSPSPASRIVRAGLLTELRSELAPSLGSTGSGRGSGGNRWPIDAGMLRVWSDVTGRVQALYEDLEGVTAEVGSVEQIIVSWSRDLIAADMEARARQDLAGVDVVGLSQDTLRLMLHRVRSIRDRIEHHFNPARTGDIPGVACPVCGRAKATVWDDELEEQSQMPALGWSKRGDQPLTVVCRVPGCDTTWTGKAEIELLGIQHTLFGKIFTPSDEDEAR